MAAILQDPRSLETIGSSELPFITTGPLLVATDASAAADAALRIAELIAARTGQQVMLLAVQLPAPMAAPEMQLAIPASLEDDRRAGLRAQVLDQLDRVRIHKDWPLEILTGDPAATIVKVANRCGAVLVIMGLGEHGLFDRLLGDETVLRVLRLGTVPVLAVAPGTTTLPRRVLASTDFTPSSIRAASLAAHIMNPSGSFTLAHVLSRDVDPANWNTVDAGYQGTIGRAFDLAIAHIGFASADSIERRVIAGDPANSLLALAETLAPDLIVAGSHGHGFITRLRLGSVSQKLVRGARCSVLIAPPEDGPSFLDEAPVVTTRFASYEWAERLEEFTRRNMGRCATLEVIDPEIGAQIEERGFPLVGASFDPRNGQVQIMLGALELRGRHLTHRIGGVTAVQVLRDRSGRDLLLRVAHGRGQTLLTLER